MFVCSIFVCFTTRDEIGLYVANKSKMNLEVGNLKRDLIGCLFRSLLGFLKLDVAAV